MNVKDGDINLQVNYSSKKAEEGIRKLTGALHNLRNTLKGIDLKSVVQSMNQVNDGSSKSAESGKQIAKSMTTAIAPIRKVTDELKKMNEVTKEIGMNDVLENFKKNLTMDFLTKPYEDMRKMRDLMQEVSPMNNIGVSGKPLEILDDSLGSIREISSAPVEALADTVDKIEQIGQAANTAKEPVKQLGDVVENVSKPVNEANKSLEGFNKTAEKVQKATRSSEKALNKAVPTIKKHTGAMNKLALSIKRIIWYRMIRGLIREIGQAFKEGTDNVARYSKALNGLDSNNANGAMSELATISLYLKNSIGAAVIPIINAMIPALNALANAVVGVINVFNQLFNAIAGRGVFTKAKKYAVDYADSLDKAGGSAKNLKNNLLGIDELNIISPDNAGGGGGGSDMDYSQMFEEATVDSKILDMVDELKAKIGEAIDYLKTLWDLFKEGFALSTKNINFDSITDKLKNIGKSLKDIFSDKEVVKSADKFVKKFVKALGQLTGAFVSIGYSLALNIVGGIDIYLNENAERIKKSISELFDINGDTVEIWGNFATAVADVFSAFGGENGQLLTSDVFGIIGNSALAASELVSKLVRDISEVTMQPIIDNAESLQSTFDGVLGNLSTVSGGIKNLVDQIWDSLNGLYDSSIKPFFDDLATSISSGLGVFLSAYDTYVKPFVDVLSENISKLMDEHLGPAFEKIAGFIGSCIENIQAVWDSIKPLIDWVVQAFVTHVMPLIARIANQITIVVSVIIDLVGDIFKSLGGLIDFVTGVFTGDWEKAWNGIKDFFGGIIDAVEDIADGFATFIIQIFSDMLDGIADVLNTLLDVVETVVNGVIGGINAGIDALNGLSFDVPDWVPEIGGKTFGFDLDHIDTVSLPRLASGGILPGTGQLFVAREAGPEMVGGWGNQTAVANNEQIVAGIQSGVASAVTQTLAPYLSQIATNTGVTANKDFSVNIGDREIARANVRGQKSMGRRLIATV